MRSASEFLRVAQENAFRHPRYGFDFEDLPDVSPRGTAFHAALVKHLANPRSIEDIPDRGLNLHRNLRDMPRTLKEDIEPRILAAHRALWDNTIAGILPLGSVNGCVFRDDGRGNRLDSFVIALNYGLVFGCESLAQALTIELLDGDLAPYYTDGTSAFAQAVRRCLNPTAEVVDSDRRERSWPPEVEAKVAIRTGALVSIMLQFVTLHEFGHVVNGDVASENGVRRFSVFDNSPEAEIKYRRKQADARGNWPCEFAADAYAIETLCDWSSHKPTCWPNVAQVYLLFGWLEQVERAKRCPLCPYHPPPKERQKFVLRRAYELSPSGPPQDYFRFIDQRVEAWAADAT